MDEAGWLSHTRGLYASTREGGMQNFFFYHFHTAMRCWWWFKRQNHLPKSERRQSILSFHLHEPESQGRWEPLQVSCAISHFMSSYYTNRFLELTFQRDICYIPRSPGASVCVMLWLLWANILGQSFGLSFIWKLYLTHQALGACVVHTLRFRYW